MLKKLLIKYFKYKKFINNQKKIILSLIKKKNVFIINTTGAGKSLCYQYISIILKKLTFVISPLISLMKDQIYNIKKNIKNINNIKLVNLLISSYNKKKRQNIKKNILNHKIKLLYLSPELFNNSLFFLFLKKIKIKYLVIDEAHCIFNWGNNFRPQYKKIFDTLKKLNKIILILITSTITNHILNKIINNLKIKKIKIYKCSYNRKNLYYKVINKNTFKKNIINYIKKLSPPGIIYCFTKKKVNNLTKKLVKNKIKVLKYHSNLQIKKRNYNQKKFLKNNKYIIICTIAFGMGINKSNIRFIIHYNIPKTIEDYFQETGRAGRDNKKSICILLYNNKDIIYIKKILLYYKNFFILRKFIKVIEYIYTSISRRKYLLNYFNENINEYNIKKYGIDDNIKYLQKYIKINKLLIFIKNKKKIKINNLFIIFKKKQYNYKYIINILIIKKILLLYKKKYIIFNYKKKKILNINYYIPYNHNNNFKNKKKCNLKLLFFLYNIRKNISKKIKYEEEYILNNYTLQYIAYNPPLNKKQFFKLKGIHILQIKKWGNFFLKKIKLFKNFFL